MTGIDRFTAAMRLACAAALAALGLIWVGPAGAQTREDVERCRAIQNDARRLACYDEIRLSPGPPLSKYEAVPLDELKTFALSYRGQLVEVTGWLTMGEDFFFLGIDASDEDPMPIDFGAIPRHERQAFLAECGEGCAAAVQGRVRPVNFTTGIVADALIAR
jgi:hypothetical protein